jgi:hypothetical protein
VNVWFKSPCSLVNVNQLTSFSIFLLLFSYSVQQDASLQLLSNAVNNWAWAQAAASLTPALSQLAASNVQQQQQKLRQAFEEQLRANASAELARPKVPKPVAPPPAPPPVASVQSSADSPAQQLARSYEAHLQSLREEPPPHGQGFEHDSSLSLQSRSSDMVTNQTLSSMTQRNMPHSSLSSTTQILPKQFDSITTHQLLLRQALEKAAQALHDSMPIGGVDQHTPSVDAPGNPSRQAPKNAVQQIPLRQTAASKSQNEISNHMTLQSVVASSQFVPTKLQMQYPQMASSAVQSNVMKLAHQVETQSHAQRQQHFAGEGGVKQDEEAATSLIGLLNSLRQSYEDAVGSNSKPAFSQAGGVESDMGKKQVRLSGGKNHIAKKKTAVSISVGEKSVEEDKSASKRFQRNSRRKNGRALLGSSQLHPPVLPQTVSTGSSRSAYVTDTSTLSRSETSSGTSSQPNESSLDDSDSKTDPSSDPSSSEESYEKEDPIPQRSQGPPRKRHKARRQVQEFTTENVLQHSERMKQESDRSKHNGAY